MPFADPFLTGLFTPRGEPEDAGTWKGWDYTGNTGAGPSLPNDWLNAGNPYQLPGFTPTGSGGGGVTLPQPSDADFKIPIPGTDIEIGLGDLVDIVLKTTGVNIDKGGTDGKGGTTTPSGTKQESDSFNPKDLLGVIPYLLPFLNLFGGDNPDLVGQALQNLQGPLNRYTNFLNAPSTIPENFDEFYKWVSGMQSASPLGNATNQTMSSLFQGGPFGEDIANQLSSSFQAGAGNPAGVQWRVWEDLLKPDSASADQERQFTQMIPGLMTGASGLLSGFGDLQSQIDPTGLIGRTQSLMAGEPGNQLFDPIQEAILGIVNNQGMDPKFLEAARERILGPAVEDMEARLNRRGGGIADTTSGLFQELLRRQENDFLNDMILNSQSNLQNALAQGRALGGERTSAMLAGQQAGQGLQGQMFAQGLGAYGAGQQGLTNRLQLAGGLSQIPFQQAMRLNDLLAGVTQMGQNQMFAGADFAQNNLRLANNFLSAMTGAQGQQDALAGIRSNAMNQNLAGLAQAVLRMFGIGV